MKTFGIREDVLRDTRYPVHRIADRLLPYLKVLVEQFHPEQVILFGSYAYGQPDEHSDVDLLVIKNMGKSSVSERRAILKAWRPLRWTAKSLPFELLLVSPAEHEQRLARGGGFYGSITRDGLLVA
ncbi:MAG: nucleotidyltransferase domain-containing protein [Terrimicrobiaceae bacterium]|nr:nucleotidyltransferase domain-containing protein [Terrimicrobiaceae bacterium]